MKKIRFLLFIIGIGLTLFGVFSAIKQSNVYWYSYFVVGIFLVCDYIDYQFRGKSVSSPIFDKNYRNFLFIYIFFVVASVFIELFGRIIGKMWYYPNYGLVDHIIHVFLIAYPFGGLSVVALYQVFKDLSGRVFGYKPNYEFLDKFFKKTGTLLIILSIAILIFLAVYYICTNSKDTRLFILGVACLFGLDTANFEINKRSIFSEIIAGNFSVIFSIIITAIVSGLIHEVPNTFSYEWIYQNIPFVSYEIWDVNVLVLTLGWIFLTIVSVIGYNLVVGDKESLSDKFRQRVREI